MIDLTPLDVRKKRGDFRRAMRGYDPAEVDAFLDLVAERLEALVKENLTLRERTTRLGDQVKEQRDREKAVQEALVTAQELRKDISGQAQREADLLRREAEAEIERMVMEAELRVEEVRLSMDEMSKRRNRFLRSFRALLERELDAVEVAESRRAIEDEPIELELFERAWAPGPHAADAANAGDAAHAGGPDAAHAVHAVHAIDPVDPDEAPGPEATPEAAVPSEATALAPEDPPGESAPTRPADPSETGGGEGGEGGEGDDGWQPHWKFSLGPRPIASGEPSAGSGGSAAGGGHEADGS